MENRNDIIRLIERYRQGTATEEEVRDLLNKIQAGTDAELMEVIVSEGLLNEPAEWMKQSTEIHRKLDVVFEQVMQRRDRTTQTGAELPRSRSVVRNWLSVAAVALVLFSLGWVFFRNQPVSYPKDVEPGAHRATLTLADGQTIGLSETQKGIVMGKEITYLDGSDVSAIPHQIAAAGGDKSPMSLSTRNGGTYQLTLPDGTRVWLNAASTLKYPARFDGEERVVELQGEAYFDVQNSETLPFKVLSQGQTIEVLGTSFNVNAYPDETATTTTLVSGALRVTLDDDVSDSPGVSVVLKPGEAVLHSEGQLEKIGGDLDASTGWKDGYFVFNNATMEAIARQIERWYGIQVICVDLPSDQTFSAEMPRDVKLSTLLKLIESTTDFRCELADNPDDPTGERRLMISK